MFSQISRSGLIENNKIECIKVIILDFSVGIQGTATRFMGFRYTVMWGNYDRGVIVTLQ